MIFNLFDTESGYIMNIVEAHTMKAMAVEELSKKMNTQKAETLVSNQTVAKTEEVPFDLELMALANNPYLVESHLHKFRNVTK